MEQFKLDTDKLIEQIKNQQLPTKAVKEVVCITADILQTLLQAFPDKGSPAAREIVTVVEILTKSVCKILSDNV